MEIVIEIAEEGWIVTYKKCIESRGMAPSWVTRKRIFTDALAFIAFIASLTGIEAFIDKAERKAK